MGLMVLPKSSSRSTQQDLGFSHHQVPGDLEGGDEGAQLDLLAGASSQAVPAEGTRTALGVSAAVGVPQSHGLHASSAQRPPGATPGSPRWGSDTYSMSASLISSWMRMEGGKSTVERRKRLVRGRGKFGLSRIIRSQTLSPPLCTKRWISVRMSCRARPFSVFSSMISGMGASQGLASRHFPDRSAPHLCGNPEGPPQRATPTPEATEIPGKEQDLSQLGITSRAKDTAVGGGKILVQHPVEDVGDVRLEGMPRAGVNVLLCHLPKGHGGALRKRREQGG